MRGRKKRGKQRKVVFVENLEIYEIDLRTAELFKGGVDNED